MSLRILFADDSVTAQNMGRKILTEAGYEVVAVSNGAAAVKKIAEQKPDIIILDVYMPGYSGLEVCEKVRGSMETLKTPVLLTVGKMEPYKPEDANRVKADGVIVKPFEASDLLAIVKKFEERIGQSPAAAQQALGERLQEEIPEPPAELPVELPIKSTAPKPTVEVPDHMATASAFSDLLGGEAPPGSGNHFEPSTNAAHETPFAPRSPVPDYELPVSWRERDEPDAEFPSSSTAKPVQGQPAPEPIISPPPPPPAASRPLQIPVYEEREPAQGGYEVMPTSAPPIGDIEIPRDPELEETAAEATRNTVADITEPGLVPSHQPVEAPASVKAMAADLAPVEEPFTPAGFQDIPADIVSHLPPPVVEPAPAMPSKPRVERLSEADFEARVAAAMSAYSQAHEAPRAPRRTSSSSTELPSRGFESQLPASAAAEGDLSEVVPAASEESVPAAASPRSESPIPTFEYRPPVHAAAEAPGSQTSGTEAVVDQHTAVADVRASSSPSASAPSVPELTTDHHEALVAQAAAAASGADHQSVSQAVHRVVERLKPELVEEILRELKSKKE